MVRNSATAALACSVPPQSDAPGHRGVAVPARTAQFVICLRLRFAARAAKIRAECNHRSLIEIKACYVGLWPRVKVGTSELTMCVVFLRA